MKKYAIVKDHISGNQFGLVVRDGFMDTCYGLSAKGEAWAESYNELETKNLQDELPYGIKVGDFRGMSSNEEILIADMIDGNRNVTLPNRESMIYAGSQKTGANSRFLDVSGAPLSFFNDNDFQDALEFKVRSFLNESSRSSVMAKVRIDRLGVKLKGLTFKSRDNDEYLRDDLTNMANGSGLLRRAVKEVFEAKEEARYGHSGYSLSPFEPEVKALGPKLGGGLRAAPRGMSFVDITGRVDGDSDGIVFEGVPGMERPIIPRFMVPKNMARRISALVDGDSMEIEKQRRSGNANASIDEGRLQELLGDQANLVRRIDGQGLQSRRAERRGREDYPRIDSETTDRLRGERFIPESSRSGTARQSRILSTPAADGGPSSRAIRERSGRVVPEPPARQGGMRSQRDYVDMDLTMDEVAQLKETVDNIRDAIRAANDDESNDLFDAFSDSLDDAALGVDVVRLKKNDAEKIRKMLDNLLRDENDAGNPDPELSDALDAVSRAIDAPDGKLVSPAVDDEGTRLSLRSQRSQRDYIDMDLTMDEVAQLKETVDNIRDAIRAANDDESNDLFDAFSDSLDDAALGVDVVRLKKNDAEKIRKMLDNLLRDENDAGNPDPELSDALDAVSRAIDAPDGKLVSPAVDDEGTRLSLRSQRSQPGYGQVRRDSNGNIIPEDSDRMNRLAESRNTRLRELGFDDDQIDQLTQGLRNRRAIDDMNSEELSTGIRFAEERIGELRDELKIDKFWESMFEAHPESSTNWVRNNFDGDFADGMAIADELRRQRALIRDMRGRVASTNRDLYAPGRRQRQRDYMNGFAEDLGFDSDELNDLIDEILEKLDEFNDGFPGEFIHDNKLYTPSRSAAGWQARINNEEETVRGRMTEGPMKGATYEYFREQEWPNGTSGGHHSLYVETPDKNVYRFEAGIEDELGLESIHKVTGTRSTRATGKQLWSLIDGIDRNRDGYASIDDRTMANLMEAAAVLDGKGHAGSAGQLMNELQESIRRLDAGGRLLGMNEDDRSSLSGMLQDTLDELVDRRKSGMRRGLRQSQGRGKKGSKAKQRSLEAIPTFTDTSNEFSVATVGYGPNGSRPLRAVKNVNSGDRKLFAILKANGFEFDNGNSGTGGKIILPDRLHLWTKTQGADVSSGWPGPGGTTYQAPPGSGLAYRTTHFKKSEPFGDKVEQWLKRIFGPDAIADLKQNSKNGGKGKVGYVPSADEVRRSFSSGIPGGLRSGRLGNGWSTGLADRTPLEREWAERLEKLRSNPEYQALFNRGIPTTAGLTRADRRSAQMDVTGTSGLGGGMRSRKKRGISGRTKKSDTDGKAWESLSDAQRSVVKKAAQDRQGRLFWDISRQKPLQGARENMLDDGLWRADMSNEEMMQIPPDHSLLPIMAVILDQALKDGEIDAATHTRMRQQLDDLQTLSQMRKDDNYSLLEHLHSSSKNRIIGDSRKEDETIPTPAGLGINSESSFYSASTGEGAAAQTEQVTSRAAKRKGKRRSRLVDRILRPDPDRQQRRQNRRMRRAGTSGRTATQADISSTQMARRKLARALRRARRKFRGERNEKSIRQLFNDQRSKSPLKRAADGTPKVDDDFIDFGAFIQTQILGRQTGEIDKKTADDVLLNLWENGEMNGKPVLISEDEFQALIDAGWKPIHRGMGKGGSVRQYVDSYKEDSDRFIPSQGGRAYGVGEYWAPEGGGHWGSYGDGVVGFVDPDGRGISTSDLDKVQEDHKRFGRELSELMSELGTDVLKNEDPANAVAQIRQRFSESEKRLGVAGLLEQSEMGKIYDQALEQYSKLKPDDQKREKIWDMLMYLQTMRTKGQGYYGPLLGYDYVDHGGVVLVHNRGTVAILDSADPISGGAAATLIKEARG